MIQDGVEEGLVDMLWLSKDMAFVSRENIDGEGVAKLCLKHDLVATYFVPSATFGFVHAPPQLLGAAPLTARDRLKFAPIV